MAKHAVGDIIYYTGDMANASGWFRVARISPMGLDLKEVGTGNRSIPALSASQVGDVYEGHCGTRFVTEKAYMAYRDAAIARFSTFVRIGAAS